VAVVEVHCRPEEEDGGTSFSTMTTLYKDLCFTFRFADDRIIPRFHLEGVEAERFVSDYNFDHGSSS
jgi:hypothetical protein